MRHLAAGFSIHLRLRIVRKNCLAPWPIPFPFQSTPGTILYTAPPAPPLPPLYAATASPVAPVTSPYDSALPVAAAAPCC